MSIMFSVGLKDRLGSFAVSYVDIYIFFFFFVCFSWDMVGYGFNSFAANISIVSVMYQTSVSISQ